MGISSDARAWLLRNAEGCGVYSTAEIAKPVVVVEDTLARLRGFRCKTEDTISPFTDLCQFILHPALRSQNDEKVCAYVFCLDNLERTPPEKKQELDGRDEKRGKPYPADAKLTDTGIKSDLYPEVNSDNGVDVKRLVESRHLRGQIQKLVMNYVRSLGAAFHEIYLDIAVDNATDSVYLKAQTQLQDLRRAAIRIKMMYYGEGEIAAAYWSIALAKQGFASLLRVTDGDIIPIMGITILGADPAFKELCHIYWQHRLNPSEPLPAYLQGCKVPPFIRLAESLVKMHDRTGLSIGAYLALCIFDGTDFFTKKTILHGVGFKSMAEFCIARPELLHVQMFQFSKRSQPEWQPYEKLFRWLCEFYIYFVEKSCSGAKFNRNGFGLIQAEEIAQFVSRKSSSKKFPDKKARESAFAELVWNVYYWDLLQCLDWA